MPLRIRVESTKRTWSAEIADRAVEHAMTGPSMQCLVRSVDHLDRLLNGICSSKYSAASFRSRFLALLSVLKSGLPSYRHPRPQRIVENPIPIDELPMLTSKMMSFIMKVYDYDFKFSTINVTLSLVIQ